MALEAIKCRETVAEFATTHELQPTQIAARKRQTVEKLAQVFDEKWSRARQERGWQDKDASASAQRLPTVSRSKTRLHYDSDAVQRRLDKNPGKMR